MRSEAPDPLENAYLGFRGHILADLKKKPMAWSSKNKTYFLRIFSRIYILKLGKHAPRKT